MPSRENECLTISVEATAKILGISRGLAYSMIHEKRIPALYFGRCIRVPKAALERLLNAQGTNSKTEEV